MPFAYKRSPSQLGSVGFRFPRDDAALLYYAELETNFSSATPFKKKTISSEFKVTVCGLVGANIQLSISPSAPLITPYVRYSSYMCFIFSSESVWGGGYL